MRNRQLISDMFLASAICATHLVAQGTQRELTTEESRRLAYEALPSAVKRLPGLTLVPGQKREPPQKCITFDGLWANPGAGSVHVGFWAVDVRTGEVWTPVLCERVKTKSLGKLQRAVRKKLGVSYTEWQKSVKQSACCNPDHYSRRSPSAESPSAEKNR